MLSCRPSVRSRRPGRCGVRLGRVESSCFIENDMCLAEWGSDPVEGAPTFVFTLMRQWSLSDADDGSYDDMKQLHLTLNFDLASDTASLARGAIWSGDDVVAWSAEVAS